MPKKYELVRKYKFLLSKIENFTPKKFPITKQVVFEATHAYGRPFALMATLPGYLTLRIISKLEVKHIFMPGMWSQFCIGKFG